MNSVASSSRSALRAYRAAAACSCLAACSRDCDQYRRASDTRVAIDRVGQHLGKHLRCLLEGGEVDQRVGQQDREADAAERVARSCRPPRAGVETALPRSRSRPTWAYTRPNVSAKPSSVSRLGVELPRSLELDQRSLGVVVPEGELAQPGARTCPCPVIGRRRRCSRVEPLGLLEIVEAKRRLGLRKRVDLLDRPRPCGQPLLADTDAGVRAHARPAARAPGFPARYATGSRPSNRGRRGPSGAARPAASPRAIASPSAWGCLGGWPSVWALR